LEEKEQGADSRKPVIKWLIEPSGSVTHIEKDTGLHHLSYTTITS
jgi:hypothetical protein